MREPLLLTAPTEHARAEWLAPIFPCDGEPVEPLDRSGHGEEDQHEQQECEASEREGDGGMGEERVFGGSDDGGEHDALGVVKVRCERWRKRNSKARQ
jgi:hypothetical protein